MIEKLQELTPREREEFLNNHASSIVEGQYFRHFDSEDMSEEQKEFTAQCIQISRTEAEFDTIKAEWKGKLKKLAMQRDIIMQNIMQSGQWLDGKQYLFDNQETGMMTYYDKDGQIIKSRRLLPEERQMNILSLTKTAGQ